MKQTAVDFLAAEQAELFLQFTNKKISLSEYAVNITNAHKQAKDFFREQIEESFEAGYDYGIGLGCGRRPESTNSDKYFTQTFNQEK